MTSHDSPFTPEQLEMLRRIVADANEASERSQRLGMESAQALLRAVEEIGLRLFSLMGLLIRKGVISSTELEGFETEIASGLEVDKAVDPEVAAVFDELRQLQDELRRRWHR
jgi:hypothetical protein